MPPLYVRPAAEELWGSAALQNSSRITFRLVWGHMRLSENVSDHFLFLCFLILTGRLFMVGKGLAENDIRLLFKLLGLCPLPAITANRSYLQNNYIGGQRSCRAEGLTKRSRSVVDQAWVADIPAV